MKRLTAAKYEFDILQERRKRIMMCAKSLLQRAAVFGVAVVCLQSSLRAQVTTGDAALDRHVAERFALLADQISLTPEIPTAGLRQSAALLDLARQLVPDEFRFARQSADLYLRLGDRDRAIDALTAVRRIEPSDQLAMVQYIDLIESKMETAEAKIAYLMQIADARGVAPEVQSHAAYKLVDLYYARGQDSEAEEALKKSLQLNNQNLAALKRKYQIAAQGGDAKTRVRALVELMRAAPTNTEGMIALAHEADAIGDFDNSASMRIFALRILASQGVAPDINEIINFTGTQMLADRPEAVQGMLGQLGQLMKEDGRYYTISLLFLQSEGQELTADAIPMARGVYLAQLAGVSQLLNDPEKKEMPTTNPAVPMPNVRADIAKLKSNDPNRLATAYAVALTEQLWFDLYFKAAEVDDATIDALGDLIGKEDPIVVRLQGWKLLNAGKGEEARLKFEAVADRDGFARLGVATADLESNQAARARREIETLLAQRPTGMFATYVAALAKRAEVRVDTIPQDPDISGMLGSISRYINDVLSNPRAYYLMTANPEKVSYAYGEPMLATVTLTNNGQQSITIGGGGLIQPMFGIDLQVRTVPPQGFPGVARGMFTNVIKLKPGQTIRQTVRIDRDQLFGYLQQFSTRLFPITGYVTTNPIPDGQTGWRSGAGGQQAKLGKAFERQSTPLEVESYKTKTIDQVSKGSPLERARAVELLGPLVPWLKSQSDNSEAQELAKAIEQALDEQLKNEPLQELRVWMQSYHQKGLSTEQWFTETARSKTTVGQVLAILAVRYMDKANRDLVARTVLDSGPVPAVAELAQALLAQPDLKLPQMQEDVQGE